VYKYVFNVVMNEPYLVCESCLIELFGEVPANCEPTDEDGPCVLCGKKEEK